MQSWSSGLSPILCPLQKAWTWPQTDPHCDRKYIPSLPVASTVSPAELRPAFVIPHPGSVPALLPAPPTAVILWAWLSHRRLIPAMKRMSHVTCSPCKTTREGCWPLWGLLPCRHHKLSVFSQLLHSYTSTVMKFHRWLDFWLHLEK